MGFLNGTGAKSFPASLDKLQLALRVTGCTVSAASFLAWALYIELMNYCVQRAPMRAPYMKKIMPRVPQCSEGTLYEEYIIKGGDGST